MGFGAQVSAPHVHCAALELIQVPILRELREILRTTVPGVTPPDTYIYKIYRYDYIYIYTFELNFLNFASLKSYRFSLLWQFHCL